MTSIDNLFLFVVYKELSRVSDSLMRRVRKYKMTFTNIAVFNVPPGIKIVYRHWLSIANGLYVLLLCL